MEEDYLLHLGGGYLWTVIHHPAEPGGFGAIICAPFGTEKVKAHRTLVALARALAAKGLVAIRFDHRGEGDSGGDFSDFAFEERLDDVDAVVELLEERCRVQRWGGVGLRLGATILASAAARRAHRGGPLPPLSLWAPVLRARPYLEDLLRANLVQQGIRHGRVLRDRAALLQALTQGEEVAVDGFPFTRRLMEESRQLELGRALDGWEGPVQVLDLDRRSKKALPRDLQGLAEAREIADLASLRCGSRFWLDFRYHRPHETGLFERTISFLEEGLRAPA